MGRGPSSFSEFKLWLHLRALLKAYSTRGHLVPHSPRESKDTCLLREEESFSRARGASGVSWPADAHNRPFSPFPTSLTQAHWRANDKGAGSRMERGERRKERDEGGGRGSRSGSGSGHGSESGRGRGSGTGRRRGRGEGEGEGERKEEGEKTWRGGGRGGEAEREGKEEG